MYSMLTDRKGNTYALLRSRSMRVRAPLLILAAGWAHPRSRLQAGSASTRICNFVQPLSMRTIDLSGTAG